jgi:hypothetical protein
MPAFTRTPRFLQDLKKLTTQNRARFRDVVLNQFVPDLIAGQFRPGLRVKRVVATAKVWEMTWAPDGRATFEYGDEVGGQPHVVWRRIGTRDVFTRP